MVLPNLVFRFLSFLFNVISTSPALLDVFQLPDCISSKCMGWADLGGYMESLHGKYTYEDSRHKIRSTLAGRAAETVVFGSTNVESFGARTDLVNASTWAKELVGACGFPADIDTTSCVGSNLLVTDEEPTASEQAHVETLARQYLKAQFEYVTTLLVANRSLLDFIVAKLMKTPVLFHEDLLNFFPTHVQIGRIN